MNFLSSVKDALIKRERVLCQYSAVRLFDGSADGISSLFIDSYGSYIVIKVLAHSEANRLIKIVRQSIKELVELFDVEDLYLWIHYQDPKQTGNDTATQLCGCLLYTSPSPRDRQKSRMPSSA